MVCGCPKPTLRRSVSKMQYPEEKTFSEVRLTDTFPKPPPPVEDCNCKQRRGNGADATLKFSDNVLKLDAGQVTDADDEEGITVMDPDIISEELADEDLSASSDEPGVKRKWGKKKKKKKAKGPKRKKKKKTKEGQMQDTKSVDGKPVKRSCCIRFLKFVCCSSCV